MLTVKSANIESYSVELLDVKVGKTIKDLIYETNITFYLSVLSKHT